MCRKWDSVELYRSCVKESETGFKPIRQPSRFVTFSTVQKVLSSNGNYIIIYNYIITVYLILRVWLPVFQTAVHIQRAKTISTALLTTLFLSYSRDAQQWQEHLDDEELCLLLGVFCSFNFIIKLQWQCESALNVLLCRITFN